MIQLGQHPAPLHTIAHISDTHFLAEGRALFDEVDTAAQLEGVLAQLESSDIRPDALVFTGDLADAGEPGAYRRLRAMVEPVAERLGASVIWVMGNHDERLRYSEHLYDVEPTQAPQDRAHDLAGLRVISLDTSVPGYHHGELSDAQLDWLRGVLATPAPHGTLIALHHPPMPTPLLWAMEILELRGQDRLAAVVENTDVRGILGGHLHFAGHSTFAGIPVSVAAATCYTLDLSASGRLLSGVDGGRSMTIVHVYEDRLVHSVVPIGVLREVTSFSSDHRARIEAMTAEERIEMFSSKSSSFNAVQSEEHGEGEQRDA